MNLTAPATTQDPRRDGLAEASESNSSETTDAERFVHLTEISAVNWPISKNYKYRCRVTIVDEDEARNVKKNLYTRIQPDWLLNIKHLGHCRIEVALLYRDSEDAEPWQEAGRVEMQTADVLSRRATADVNLPITGWSAAPQMRLRLRLTKSRKSTHAKSLALVHKIMADARADHHLSAPRRREERVTVTVPELEPLSPQEEVVVKDSWNKLLAFKELAMEMFFQRLLVEEPRLEDAIGHGLVTIHEKIFEMFDLAVRQLQPQTEVILRESYRGIHPSPEASGNSIEEYGSLFCDLGMKAQHWLTARKVWMWVFPSLPYIEEYEQDNLALGSDSAFYRFYTIHVLKPMVACHDRWESALPPEALEEIRDSWRHISERKREMGIEFYHTLFRMHPEIIPYFGRSDMDHLAVHLFQSLDFMVHCLNDWDAFLPELRELSRTHSRYGVPRDAYPKIARPIFAVFEKHIPGFSKDLRSKWMKLLLRVINVMVQPKENEERLLAQALEYQDLISRELAWDPPTASRRVDEIRREIVQTGTYSHTYEELAYGAQVAWRNSPKCIGRIQWKNLVVRDARDVVDAEEMYEEICEHLRVTITDGNIQSTMTVFRPKNPGERWGPRIWNAQLYRYAGYREKDGSILGEPSSLALTEAIMNLGWEPPSMRTAFDLLPWVIELPGEEPELFDIPEDLIHEVWISHPTNEDFAGLGLKWYAIPAISNFRLELGGINYGCMPFNGWYMGTEIARNLSDTTRYDRLKSIAKVLGLDTSSEQTLWRDRAFVELNAAILHSFQKARVTLVDHHSASQQFLAHDLREKKEGRECPAQWSWVVPPAGGSVCPVYHHEMRDFFLSPHYYYSADKWAVEDGVELVDTVELDTELDHENLGLLVLFGSETGTAERFARQTARRLHSFRPQVLGLDDFDPEDLAPETVLLVVTSTFGEGEMPGNGRLFLERLQKMDDGSRRGLKFSVMALGSTVYEHFCAAGVMVDQELKRLGGAAIVPIHKGDEIKGQAETFEQWLDVITRMFGEDPTALDASALRSDLEVIWLEDKEVEDVPRRGARRPGKETAVLANRELLENSKDPARSTRFVSIDLSGLDTAYEAGDHVAVHPPNPDALVEDLCERLGVDPEKWFTARYLDQQDQETAEEPRFPVPTTVRRVLTEYLDLHLHEPWEDLLGLFYEEAENVDEAHRLEGWLEILRKGGGDLECVELKKQLSDRYLTVLDLLEDFPSVEPVFGDFLEALPKQKPRFYSISSSPLEHPKQIDLTVGLVSFTTDAGRSRKGLCSSYLADRRPMPIPKKSKKKKKKAPLVVDEAAKVRIALRSSSFRLPTDLDAPLLMVGPGTGLAPFRGFLQERAVRLRDAADGADRGSAVLYFGCRDEDDYLYREELEQWLEWGVLSRLEVAFSRKQKEKVYVQHLMEDQADELWEMLEHPKCHYYVCGDTKMATDVYDVLLEVARNKGGMSHFQSVEFFDRMKAEKRFQTDVWGVTLNYEQTIEELRAENYARGEAWLEKMNERAEKAAAAV